MIKFIGLLHRITRFKLAGNRSENRLQFCMVFCLDRFDQRLP